MIDVGEITEKLRREEKINIDSPAELLIIAQEIDTDALPDFFKYVSSNMIGERELINSFLRYVSIVQLIDDQHSFLLFLKHVESSVMCFSDMTEHFFTYFRVINKVSPEQAHQFIKNFDFKEILKSDTKALLGVVISISEEKITESVRQTLFQKLYNACVHENINLITTKPQNIIKKLSPESVKVFCATFSEYFIGSATYREKLEDAPINTEKLKAILNVLNPEKAKALISGLSKNLQEVFGASPGTNFAILVNEIQDNAVKELFFNEAEPHINKIHDYESLYYLLCVLNKPLQNKVIVKLGAEKIKELVRNTSQARNLLGLRNPRLSHIVALNFGELLQTEIYHDNQETAEDEQCIEDRRVIVWQSLNFMNDRQKSHFLERYLYNCQELIFSDMTERGTFLKKIVPHDFRHRYIEILFKNSIIIENKVIVYDLIQFTTYLTDEELQKFIDYQGAALHRMITQDNVHRCLCEMLLRLPYNTAISYLQKIGNQFWSYAGDSEYFSRFFGSLTEKQLAEFLKPFFPKGNDYEPPDASYLFKYNILPTVTRIPPARIDFVLSNIRGDLLTDLDIDRFASISNAIKDAPEDTQLRIIQRLNQRIAKTDIYYHQVKSLCELISGFESQKVLGEICKNLPYLVVISAESRFSYHFAQIKLLLSKFNAEQFACFCGRVMPESLQNLFFSRHKGAEGLFGSIFTTDKLEKIAKRMQEYRNFSNTNLLDIFQQVGRENHESLLDTFASFIRKSFDSPAELIKFMQILTDSAKSKLCELKSIYLREKLVNEDSFKRLLRNFDEQSQQQGTNFSFFVIKQAAQLIINDLNMHAQNLRDISSANKGSDTLIAYKNSISLATLATQLTGCLDTYKFGQDIDSDKRNRKDFVRQWSSILRTGNYVSIANCTHTAQTHSKAKDRLIAVATAGIALASTNFRARFFTQTPPSPATATPKKAYALALRFVNDCGGNADEYQAQQEIPLKTFYRSPTAM